jgi:carboxylesterase
LATTTFADWSAAAERAYHDLVARCDRVVVAGLSMGALLTAWLATRHAEIAGLVVINGVFAPIDATLREAAEQMVAQGVARIPGPGNDIADQSQTELAYTEAPPEQFLSLFDAIEAIQDDLVKIRCPVLVINSEQDHVVPAGSSDHFAAAVSGAVERMDLTRSFHVATLDLERAGIEARAVTFATEVTADS